MALEALAGIAVLFVLIVAAVAIALLVLGILMVIGAHKAGRSGWWIYLICLFISPLNIIAIIAWHVHLKNNPWRITDDIVM